MTGGPKPRVSSPAPGRSILITSAPRSASICTQVGPASTRVRSNTRRPFSGPVGSVISISKTPVDLFGPCPIRGHATPPGKQPALLGKRPVGRIGKNDVHATRHLRQHRIPTIVAAGHAYHAAAVPV